MKFLAYAWSGRRSQPALRDEVVAALAQARPHRLGWARQRAARLPRRVLGGRGHRARRRPRASAGHALRALPHAPGRSARRAARDRREGPDGPWLRRPHVLGHRALHPARAHVLGSGRGGRCAALAARHARPRARARDSARPRRRRFSVANDPRSRMLGLLACRYGGVSHQRRHRRRRDPVSVRDRRRDIRARGRPRAARRDGPAVAFARASRLPGTLPHRRRHGPGRVQRDRRQQRLHQPARAAEHARRSRCGGASSPQRCSARGRSGGGRGLARRRPRAW